MRKDLEELVDAQVAEFMADNAPTAANVKAVERTGDTYTTTMLALAQHVGDIAETPAQLAGIPMFLRFAAETAVWEMPLV